jgi:hypothetical protein
VIRELGGAFDRWGGVEGRNSDIGGDIAAIKMGSNIYELS